MRKPSAFAQLTVVFAATALACGGANVGSTDAGSAQGATVSVTPDSTLLSLGGAQAFAAAVTGVANTGVTWRVVEGSAGGSIGTDGSYVAPSSTGTFHVEAASVADPSVKGTAAVTVAGPGVHIDQRFAVVRLGLTATFTATVTSMSDTRVTWAVAESGGGTITSSGIYTAPQTAGTYHVLATSVANTSLADSVAVTVTAAQTTYIGGHLPELSPWTPFVYGNVLASGYPWAPDTGSGQLEASGQLDANGNPTVDAAIGFLGSTTPGPTSVVAGTYKLSFNGQATVAVDSGTIQSLAYDSATNTTTADVIVPSSGPNYILHFRSSWRNAAHTADATGNTRGITNARLMAPGHSWPQDYWYKDVASMGNAFSLMRFVFAMGPGDGKFSCNNSLTGVMGSCQTSWSTRQRPGRNGYTYKGMPWEDTVVFANLTGMDIWVHIPINADDDYIRKVGQLLKYGSDGNLPYTSQVHDPSTWSPTASWYPGLLPGRKVYVEFTNELFSYYSYGDPQAKTEIAGGDPQHLNWDGKGGGDRWNMYNVVRISLLLRETWASEMQNTVRVVFADQGDWGNWGRHQYGMDYLTYAWGPSSPWSTINGITNPKQSPSYYIYTLAGSFYLHVPTSGGVPTASSVDQFFQQINSSLSNASGTTLAGESNSVYQRIGYGEAMAAKYGLTFSTYETGLEIFQYGSVKAAWSDPRMDTVVHSLLYQMKSQPHADVAIQNSSVRGYEAPFCLSPSYSSADGFPWPRDGAAKPNPLWQAIIDVSAGR